jgi:hypothetical protein
MIADDDMIEFPPQIDDLRLLRRLVKKSKAERNPFPSLSELAPKRDVADLIAIAKSWQRNGLGSVTEEFSNGVASVSFTPNKAALEIIENDEKRKLLGRIKAIPRSDWISILALIVAAFALLRDE